MRACCAACGKGRPLLKGVNGAVRPHSTQIDIRWRAFALRMRAFCAGRGMDLHSAPGDRRFAGRKRVAGAMAKARNAAVRLAPHGSLAPGKRGEVRIFSKNKG